MTSNTEPSANLRGRESWRQWLAVPLLLCASLLMLLVFYLNVNWPGIWIGSAAPLNWAGSVFSLTNGSGSADAKGLTIDSLSDMNIATAAVVTKPFSARDYSTIQWDVEGVRTGLEIAFLWRTAEDPGMLFSATLNPTRTGVASLDLLGNENWRGQIVGLALAAKGMLHNPIVLHGVAVRPVTTGQIIRRMSAQWLAADAWDARSINFADSRALSQDLPFLPAVFAVVLLALGLYFILTVSHLLRVRLAVAGAILFSGWLLLDLRWQWVLFNQLTLTSHQYAGKSSQEKHLASEDAHLFEFMNKAVALLPSTRRVLYVSDDSYLRGKGAYYLYSRNVYAGSDLSLAAKMRTGECIVTFAKKGVRYDVAGHLLLTEEVAPISSDLLLSKDGNFVVRVR